MADWNCTSDSLGHGKSIFKSRSNGISSYGIRVEHITVEGGYIDLEIKFKEDWNKATETSTMFAGQKKTYTDPDSGQWEVAVTHITGEGLWATAVVSICYYGGPYAQITNLVHPSSAKEGTEFDCTPSVCNTGNLGGSFDIKYYEGGTLIKTVQHGRIDAGVCLQNLSGRLTMPDQDLIVTVKMCLRGTSICYDERTVTISLETVVVGDGFTINVATGLAGKTITVGHVVKMPFIGLVGPDPDLWYWPQVFDYVGGKWYTADPDTKYRVEVGSIFETIPSFNKTYGTGSFADGIHCVVLAEGDSGVNTLVFKGADVFQLFKDSPTEIYLATTSNDTISEAIMGPVCDFFGIARGAACNSFWAEFYDPVYVANYISIMQTGKDTLGNDRELSAFDHIALPFAVLGSLPGLSLLPFGALVTKGLSTVSKAGVKFGDAAVQFMLNFSMDASNFVSSKDTWHFLDAIGQVTEAHATEIVNALTAGDTTLANTLLRQYAGESKGWWDYHALNDLLKDALPTDAYNWLRTQIGLTEIGAGTVTNTAKQATLSPDCVLKLADAVKDTGVMDKATLAVYRSLKILDTATPQYIDEIRNILKNSPEISVKLVARHKKILDDVASGHALMNRESAKAILNHADLAPDDIVGMVKTADNLPLIVNKLSDGTYSQALGNFLDSTKKYWDYVNTQVGKTEADTWVRNNAKISKKAMAVDNPAKMADIPHAAQEIAAKQDSIIDEAVAALPDVSKVDAEDIIFDDGMKVGNEISEVTQVFADEAPTNWYTKARQTANIIPDRIKKKWKGLTRFEKVLVVWFMVDNMAFNVWMLAKFLGLAPGDRGFDAWNLGKSVTNAGWLCKKSCDDARYSDLESDIVILEVAINDLEVFLDKYESSLKLENNYNAPHSILEIGKAELKLYQECLVNRGIEVAPSTGKIVFFAEDEDGQAVTAGAYVDNHRVGTIWGSGLEISEVDPGSYDLEVKATGYIGCTKTVNVVALKTETFECTLQEIGACSPVVSVIISFDPKSPIKKQPVAFTGFADSDDPIETWEWDFGDGSPKKLGQAVTHTYSSDDIYAVVLKATNDCENSESATRNVTVTEEAVEEVGTLLIQKPINAVNKIECTRAWEAIIYVDGQTIGKTTPFSIPFGTDIYIGGHGGPCGTHVITIILSGYDNVSKTVTINNGDSKSWVPEMYVEGTTPNVGNVLCKTVPTGAHIVGAGVYKGVTEKTIELPAGEAVIMFYKAGYNDCVKTISVVEDSTVTAQCTMVAESESHDIDIVIPEGAKLWVDNDLITVTSVARLSTILKSLRQK